VRLTYDSAKRKKTLAERGLDFEDALIVFDGTTVEVEVKRGNYGEPRIICSASSKAGWSSSGTRRVARFATCSACGRPMIVNKLASRRTSGSDLARVDAHQIKPHAYKEPPQLTEEVLARAVINKGGRPRSLSPRQLVSLRLPPEVIERWRATGPGWQTRMVERLAKGPTPRAKSAV